MEEDQQSSRLDLDVISGEENGYPMKVYVAGYVDEEEICWQLDRMDAYDFGMQLIAEATSPGKKDESQREYMAGGPLKSRS